MTGPLSGLRILDFTTMIPGPVATLYLADMGAEVLKLFPAPDPTLILNFRLSFPATEDPPMERIWGGTSAACF